MIEIVTKIFSLLSKQERRQFIRLAVAIVAVGIIEVAGIASIMPFMAVVSNPEVVEKNHYLYWAYQTFDFTSVTSFLISLGFLVFFIILLSNSFKALVLWLELKFIHFRLYNLSRRLFFSYLSKPYIFFLNQNTSIMGKNILQEVSEFSHNVLRPCIQILSRLVVVLFILGLLLFVDPVLAVTIAIILGGSYVILFLFVQGKVTRLGKDRFESNAERSKAASEAFGGIKELKVLGRERFFIDHFSLHARKLEGNYVTSNLIGQLPSYIMEVFSFGGILIIVLYFLIIRQDLGQTLPVIALYAFAGYRLMPALQGIFSSFTLLRFNLKVLDVLYHDLSGVTEVPISWLYENVTALPFHKEIRLSSITFSYPGVEIPVIQDLNLTIEKNASVGLVGATGSGKTTLVDIILGLLPPESGSLMVDGNSVPIENILQWQKNIGYVPQSIFLSDDTLARNIAFGVPLAEINMAAVERAARIANLHDFVTTNLPEGYATNVGEHGIRLSGGQRQRIGIARALYHDPEILIMDEATSALDGITEDAVMQAISNLVGTKTVITIAHRLTTLKDCDIIYIIENGKIVESGTFADLSIASVKFRAMANASLA